MSFAQRRRDTLRPTGDGVVHGRMFGGRAVVRLIIDYNKTQPSLAQKCTFEDLEKGTQWLGDDRMDEFLANWMRVTSNMTYPIPEQLLLDLL